MVDFSFLPQKVWNLDVSISSQIMRFVCTISLSLLETRENTFGFLFSSRNWRKYLKFLHFFCKSSRSLLEPENRSQHFSFLFSKLEMWIPYFSFSSRFDFLVSRQCLMTCTTQIVEIVPESTDFLIRIWLFNRNILQIVPESTHLLIRIWLFNSNFLQIWLIWFCLKSESRTSTKIKARFYYPHQFLITILSAWSKKLSFCLKSPNVWWTLTQQSSEQTGKHRGEDGESTRLPSAWMRWGRHSTPRGL